MERLFDPIRKKLVAATPEEILRQNLLKFMIDELKYPKSHLCVEKDLSALPHLKDKTAQLPIRRVDLLCFAKNIHKDFELYPLLIIECKATRLSKESIDQVIGYNHFVASYFIALANGKEIKTFWHDRKENKYIGVDFLPSYSQLIQAVKK